MSGMEQWTPSPPVARILRQPGLCWTPTAPAFRADMLRLQADLIRHYWAGMPDQDKRRAAATLRWIDTQLSGDVT